MKYIIAAIVAFCLAWTLPAMAQSSPKLAFNQAANLFIEGQHEQALRNVNNALQRHPDDPQLKALKEKLEQQQEQQQQQEQNGEEEQEQSDQQEGDGQPQDSQDQQEGEEGEPGEQDEQQPQEGEGEEEEEGEEGEAQQPEEGEEDSDEKEGGEMDTERRLQEMNISPEKARMILEAMKSNEVQYLQQKKRKSESRSNSNKPDW